MADEQQPDVHVPDVLYTRELPGGGYVTIEGQAVPDGNPFHGALTVERRSDPERRSGHVPPVVLEADGSFPEYHVSVGNEEAFFHSEADAETYRKLKVGVLMAA